MSTLKDYYNSTVAPAMMKKFNYENVMQIPKLQNDKFAVVFQHVFFIFMVRNQCTVCCIFVFQFAQNLEFLLVSFFVFQSIQHALHIHIHHVFICHG